MYVWCSFPSDLSVSWQHELGHMDNIKKNAHNTKQMRSSGVRPTSTSDQLNKIVVNKYCQMNITSLLMWKHKLAAFKRKLYTLYRLLRFNVWFFARPLNRTQTHLLSWDFYNWIIYYIRVINDGNSSSRNKMEHSKFVFLFSLAKPAGVIFTLKKRNACDFVLASLSLFSFKTLNWQIKTVELLVEISMEWKWTAIALVVVVVIERESDDNRVWVCETRTSLKQWPFRCWNEKIHSVLIYVEIWYFFDDPEYLPLYRILERYINWYHALRCSSILLVLSSSKRVEPFKLILVLRLPIPACLFFSLLFFCLRIRLHFFFCAWFQLG